MKGSLLPKNTSRLTSALRVVNQLLRLKVYLQSIMRKFLVLLMLMVGFNSCVQDNCNGVLCYNDGVCVQGTCTCLSGYEGTQCERKWTEKFAGTWQASDTYFRDTVTNKYDLEILIGDAVDSFFLVGLTDTLDSIVCKRTGFYQFTFGENIIDTNLTIKSGIGTISNNGQTVTGVYSFTFLDSSVNTNFKWQR